MKLSLIALSLVALSACAAPVAKKPVPPVITVANEQPKAPQNVVIDKGAWIVTLPPDWIVKPGGPKAVNEQITMQAAAASPAAVGRGPMGVQVATVNLEDDDVSDEEFPNAAVAYAAHTIGALQDGALVEVDGHPTSLSMFVTRNEGVIVQEATARNRTGYVLRCGGDMQVANETVLPTCKKIVESFHVK